MLSAFIVLAFYVLNLYLISHIEIVAISDTYFTRESRPIILNYRKWGDSYDK